MILERRYDVYKKKKRINFVVFLMSTFLPKRHYDDFTIIITIRNFSFVIIMSLYNSYYSLSILVSILMPERHHNVICPLSFIIANGNEGEPKPIN